MEMPLNFFRARILLAQPQMPFGRVTIEGNLVATFEHRPFLETWANVGYYTFSKEIVAKFFLEKVDFEQRTIQQIAEYKHLKGLTYDGDWLTLNIRKDLIQIREYFATLKK